MKNLKQLILPCYKVEMAMGVEAWYFLHGSTDGVCNLTFFLSLLSKMTVTEVQNSKRGLKYSVQPGQVDSSMLVLAKEWNIGRKAVFRLLEDFSERGLINVDSNPMTSILDMVCVKSWMTVGKLVENPTYRQTVKAYEGVRIFLFNGQKLETLRRSSPRKKTAKPVDGTDNLMPIKPTVSNPIVTETTSTVSTADKDREEDTSMEADNIPVLVNGDALPDSQDGYQCRNEAAGMASDSI